MSAHIWVFYSFFSYNIFDHIFPLSQLLSNPPHLFIQSTLCSFSFWKRKSHKNESEKQTKSSKTKYVIVPCWLLWSIDVVATACTVQSLDRSYWGHFQIRGLWALCLSTQFGFFFVSFVFCLLVLTWVLRVKLKSSLEIYSLYSPLQTRLNVGWGTVVTKVVTHMCYIYDE